MLVAARRRRLRPARLPESEVPNMLAMQFLSLKCNRTSQGAGADEIYMVVNGHRASAPEAPDFWSMDDGDSVGLNFFNSGFPPGVPETRFTITLMEEDTFEDDDLGTVSFTVNDFDWFDDFWNKIRELKFTGNDADYSLFYKFSDVL
ncbi:hypothetical protein O1L60_37000 [Streptomyces diastatochromogenes]|nr:hypothetical protein [Streptomyces diastatochromogenes]